MLFLVRPSMDALTLTRAQGFVVDADALRDAFGRLSLPIGAPLGGGLLAGALFRTTHPNRFEGAAKGAQEALAPYVIELVGTCLLAFTVATATSSSADNRSSLRGEILAPMSIGAVLTSQVYAGAATSGAHYNPAITIAVSGSRNALVLRLLHCVVALMRTALVWQVSLRRALAYWESSLLVPPQVKRS
jgi:glycerol uptake facilitator-like aquaporin